MGTHNPQAMQTVEHINQLIALARGPDAVFLLAAAAGRVAERAGVPAGTVLAIVQSAYTTSRTSPPPGVG